MRYDRLHGIPTLAFLLAASLALSADAAEFIPLGFLPNGNSSQVADISDDGSVVAGWGAPLEAFRWTEADGMVGLGLLPGASSSRAQSTDVLSGDGERVVGLSQVVEDPSGGGDDIFIYTEGQGMIALGETASLGPWISADGQSLLTYVAIRNQSGAAIDDQLLFYEHQNGVWSVANEVSPFPGGDFVNVDAMSPDASIVVGYGNRPGDQPGDPWPKPQFIWTAETGTQELVMDGFEFSEESHADSFTVMEVTNDGSVMGGRGRLQGDPETDLQVFRWTEQSGAVGLGWLPGTESDDGIRSGWLYDMTDDGSVLIGSNGFGSRLKGFVWSEQFGLEELQTALIDRHGLAEELAGWDLAGPRAISPNGQFIAGTAYNPDGQIEGWLVRLDQPFASAAVPEPSAAVMLLLGSLGGVLACRPTSRPMV